MWSIVLELISRKVELMNKCWRNWRGYVLNSLFFSSPFPSDTFPLSYFHDLQFVFWLLIFFFFPFFFLVFFLLLNGWFLRCRNEELISITSMYLSVSLSFDCAGYFSVANLGGCCCCYCCFSSVAAWLLPVHKLASFFAGGRPSVFGFIPLPLSLSVVKTFPKLVSFRLLYHVVHKRERERDGGEGGIYVCDVGTHVHTCSSASCHWCPYTYICSL